MKTRLVFKCEVQKGRRASPECYSLESGLKSASRPSCSLVSKSLSGFGFLKSDGRFRMCTSFLNCWHRAVCRRGDRVGGETGVKHSQLTDNGHVELQHTFPNAARRVPPPSASWRYPAAGISRMKHCALVAEQSITPKAPAMSFLNLSFFLLSPAFWELGSESARSYWSRIPTLMLGIWVITALSSAYRGRYDTRTRLSNVYTTEKYLILFA